MATQTLADYITLLDNTQRIDGSPNGITVTTGLPADFVTGTNKAKPVLQFKIRAHQDSELSIHVNQTHSDPGLAHTMSLGASGTFRTYHEFINGNLFNPGAQNEIKFVLQGSVFDDHQGDVSISDVLLTFQRRIQI